MKGKLLLLVLTLLASCSRGTKNELVCIELENGYPKKEILLQDVWKVEYVPLETDSLFLVASDKPWYVGEKWAGFVDNKTGNLLFFDAKTGKKSFCIARKGPGPEEYKGVGGITMDEDRGEVFAWSIWDGAFLVYDMQGRFLRKLPLYGMKKGEFVSLFSVVDADETRLICSGSYMEGGYTLHYFLNKITGQAELIDSIPKERCVSPYIVKEMDGAYYSIGPNITSVVECQDGWMYAEHSNDTIFRIAKDGGMTPLVARLPKVGDSNPVRILRYDAETRDWLFLSSVEMTYDFEKKEGLNLKQYGVRVLDGSIFEVKLVNADYPESECYASTMNCLYLGADGLVEALDAGLLKGELEKVAQQLDMDDNGVLVKLVRK